MADKDNKNKAVGIIPRGESPPPAPAAGIITPDQIAAANSLHKRFMSTLKKGARLAFEIGKLLHGIWEQLHAGDSWPQWCQEHLAFDVRTANAYLRIYENYRDDPKALAGQTISGALKLLSAPRREMAKAEEAESENTDRQQELPWERYFELPPLSRKVTLNNYRFEVPNGHEVYLIRRGFAYPVKIAEVLAPEDQRLKTAHQGMLENIQAALEEYYGEVERLEALGVEKE